MSSLCSLASLWELGACAHSVPPETTYAAIASRMSFAERIIHDSLPAKLQNLAQDYFKDAIGTTRELSLVQIIFMV